MLPRFVTIMASVMLRANVPVMRDLKVHYVINVHRQVIYPT